MRKFTAAISFLTVLCFLLVTWLPCHAADDSLYICKNKKTGNPRFVNSPEKCKTKTEYLVTLTPTTQGQRGINVYDANDQYLGILSGDPPSYPTKIYLPSMKKFIAVNYYSPTELSGTF